MSHKSPAVGQDFLSAGAAGAGGDPGLFSFGARLLGLLRLVFRVDLGGEVRMRFDVLDEPLLERRRYR